MSESGEKQYSKAAESPKQQLEQRLEQGENIDDICQDLLHTAVKQGNLSELIPIIVQARAVSGDTEMQRMIAEDEPPLVEAFAISYFVKHGLKVDPTNYKVSAGVVKVKYIPAGYIPLGGLESGFSYDPNRLVIDMSLTPDMPGTEVDKFKALFGEPTAYRDLSKSNNPVVLYEWYPLKGIEILQKVIEHRIEK